MKPRLDTVPSLAAVARVALRLVARELAQRPDTTRTPAQLVLFTIAQLPAGEMGMLRFALHSLAVHLDLDVPSSEWYLGVHTRAEYGHCFRRVFFAEYKAGRRPYPRVTNRGVQTSANPAGVRKLGRSCDA